MTPTYAQGNTPLKVPLSTLITFYQILRDAKKIQDFLAQTGALTISSQKVAISDVMAVLQTLDEINKLDSMIALTGDVLVDVDPGIINTGKDILYSNQLHLQSTAANTMVALAQPGCQGHHCPHIPH